MTVLVLTEPCTRVVPHTAHPILVVSPDAPTLITTLSCPGWVFPVAPSASANNPPPPDRPAPMPNPVVPSS